MISVIVPMYNPGEFIKDCLDSLQKQTYSNFEVIIVNDGSTDGSEQFIIPYLNKDSRIRLIHQKNQGPSVARNTGIELAQGDFIYFLDSDDYIDRHTFASCIACFEQNLELNILTFDAECIFEKEYLGDEHKHFRNNVAEIYKRGHLFSDNLLLNMEHYLKTSFLGNRFKCNSVLYFFKRAVLDRANIRFMNDIKYYEDCIFTTELFLNNDNIYYLRQPFYKRRFRGNSLMTNEDYLDKLHCISKGLEYIVEWKRTTDWNREMILQLVEKHLVQSFLNFYVQCDENVKSKVIISPTILWLIKSLEYLTETRERYEVNFKNTIATLQQSMD